jgi:flagellar motility protein MotE (MotC chaperone)
MKSIITGILTVSIILTASAQVEKKEVDKEIQRLTKLKKEVQQLIKKNNELLAKLKEQEKRLDKKRKDFENFLKKAEKDRYKKLAKVFEKMDPELAGEKISKIKDPRRAAYIIYNMKERSAGATLNYVDPERVSEIVRILTEIKKYAKK